MYEEYVSNFETGIIDKCPVVNYQFSFNRKYPYLPMANLENENVFINSTLPSTLFEYEFIAVTITGLTDELKKNNFEVISIIGCFFEQNIQKSVDIGEPYDFVIALPVADPNDPTTFYYSESVRFDVFETEI